MTVRAILFDLGNTLIFQAHEPPKATLYDEMARRLRPLLRAWGVDGRLDLTALLEELDGALEESQAERRARGYEVDAPFVVRGALAAHETEVSAEQAEEFWRAAALGLTDLGWQLYPDTLDTLRRVRSLGLPAALVSNSRFGAEVQLPLLAELGITEELLDAFVFSPDVKRPKPHAAPFTRALDALDIDARDVAFVGDDLDADVRGAKALGMTTVWKLNGRHDVAPAEEADYTVHDLWEIFDLDFLPAGAATATAADRESLTPHEDDNADRY